MKTQHPHSCSLDRFAFGFDKSISLQSITWPTVAKMRKCVGLSQRRPEPGLLLSGRGCKAPLGTKGTGSACELKWEDLARVHAGHSQRPGCPRASWDLDMVCEPRGSKGQPSALELWRQGPWVQITALPLVSCVALGSSADHLATLCLSFPICHMKIIKVPIPP